MAVLNNATIATALATLFEDRITMHINRSIPLAQLLRVTNGTGKNISWVNRFGTAAPGTAVIADGAAVGTYNSDDKVPATLSFAIYHDAFSTTGLARAAARAAGNPQELVDLYAEELMESVQRLAMALAVDVYTGSGAAGTMNGLLTAASAAPGIGATGTYATVNRATYPQFGATVMANGGVPRALSLDLMREMRRRIYVASGMKPDLIVTDPIQHENYSKLFGTERRYMQSVNLRGQTIVLDGGFQVLEFDGIPIVEDVSHPAGKMTFLNTRFVELKQLPDAADGVNKSPGMVGLRGTPEEQFGEGSTSWAARIQPLAIVGDAAPLALYIYPQVQVRRPQSCGVINDLS